MTKYIILPIATGQVDFISDTHIGVSTQHWDCGRRNIPKADIVGELPLAGDGVAVFDLHRLMDAMQEGESEVIEVDLCGTIERDTGRAKYVRRDTDGLFTMIPSRFLPEAVGEYIRSVKIPKWLAIDRGLA